MTDNYKSLGAKAPGAARFRAWPALANLAFRGLLGGFVTISLLGLASHHLHQLILIAPFGASCVLLFAAPESAFAQPRNLVCGHLLTASIGLAMLWLCGTSVWSTGLAVGLAIALMEFSGTLHPPAGANPIVIMLGGKASLLFLLTPILTGALLLLLVALLINNLSGKRWPLRWW